MSIPSKEDAVKMAEEYLDMDAAKYERIIESALLLWNGKDELRMDVPSQDEYIVEHLVRKLRKGGFTARSTKRSGKDGDWWVYFR